MINSDKVSKVFLDCLFKKDELIDGKPILEPLVVQGIVMNVGFNPESIGRNKEAIEELVNQLHPTFDEGWTFLNMCLDKDNNEWTGSHRAMEQLLTLGLAIGKLDYCLYDREAWNMMPGNMPYIIRNKQSIEI